MPGPRSTDASQTQAEAFYQQGVAALAAADASAAVAAFDAAISRKPRSALYHDCRGDALELLGRDDAAISAWRVAIRLDPGAVAPLVSLGLALSRRPQGDGFAEAAQMFRRAIARDAACYAAWNGLGLVLQQLKAFDDAEAALRQAASIAPNDPDVLLNLGNVLRDRGDIQAAEPVLRAARSLAPDEPRIRFHMAQILRRQGKFAEAEIELRWLLAQEPHSAGAHLILAFLLLSTGRYQEGWEHHEWRYAAIGEAPESCPANWDGQHLQGRTLLVVADEGFGDFIQFCRFIPLAAAQGEVIVQVPLPLVRLVLRMPGITRVVVRGVPPPRFDVICSATSLPRAFQAGVAGPILAECPYLQADPADRRSWKARLARLPGRKIGLAWAGSATYAVDHLRSIPLSELTPLAGVAGVSFVSLQLPPAAIPGLPISDWTDALLDFADTAALIGALDLIICVDTAVAHLAGALGRPVWLLNRCDAMSDWRWLFERVDTPWYPTMRIFRQRRCGDWRDVIGAVCAALSEGAP